MLQTPCFGRKISKNKIIYLPKFAYNVKGYLRFSIFIIKILPNLIKYTYRCLSLSNITKLKKRRTLIQLGFCNLELNMGLNQLKFVIWGHERFYDLCLGLSNK